MGTTHGYTSERLTQLEEEARGILSDPDSTQDLDTAAREVLAAVAAIRETQGSFDRESGTVNFTAPHNYTGGSLYYRVTVSDAGTGDALFLVDIAVKAEDNPLTAALSRLEAAKNNALIAKQTEALQEASQNTGGYGGYEGGESGGETTGPGDTGDAGTGDAGDNGDAGSSEGTEPQEGPGASEEPGEPEGPEDPGEPEGPGEPGEPGEPEGPGEPEPGEAGGD